MSDIKSYGYIVNKQFKVNRKRNISTISGIILSIILFTIVGYIQNYYNDVNKIDVINRSGDYDAVLQSLSPEEVYELKNNVLVKKVGLYTEMYNSTIDIGDKEKNVKVYAVDNVILKKMFNSSMKVISGQLPKKEDEILLDNVGKYFLNKHEGDIINLGGKRYKIVGIYEKTVSNEPYSIEILTYFNESNISKGVNAVFNVISEKNKIKEIRKVVDNLGINVDKQLILNNLLFYYHNINDYTQLDSINEEKIIEIILHIAILILTVFMTYSSINISLKERIEQFSILRCIGATPSRIRALLIKESIFLAILSIIPGIILGQIVCYFISSVIFQNILTTVVPFKIYFDVIGKVAILSMVSIAISTIIPVIKVGRISPIEGVKNGGEVNDKVKNKNPKLIKKLFGYNGLLAYKNIRGNNRSFLITTITSIIILTTFITFSGYSSSILEEYNNEKIKTKDAALDINLKYEDKYKDVFEYVDRYKQEISDLGVTKDIYPRIEYYTTGIFENIKFNKDLREQSYEMNEGNKNINIHGKEYAFSDRINLMIMDDNSLKELLSRIKDDNLTLEDFKENGVLVSDIMAVKKFFNVENEPLFNLKKNEKFDAKLKCNSYDLNEKNLYEKSKDLLENGHSLEFKYLGSINLDEILDGDWYSDMTTLVVSRDFYKNNKELFAKNNKDITIEGERLNFDMEFNTNINRDKATKAIESYSNNVEGRYIDYKSSNMTVESDIIIFSSMIYLILFLTVIVGGLNLINNKYINIKMRGKEIGTLLAIGINKKRLKKIFMLEGIMQWIISTAISLLLSYTILTILYKILIYNGQISVVRMPILTTIIGCSILFIINILGSYLPIRNLEYTSTTELIRNNE